MITTEANTDAACFQLSIDQRPREVIARFTVEGEPISKARARFTAYGSKVRSYTPQKTLDGEKAVAKAFTGAVGESYKPSTTSTFCVYCLFFNSTRQRRDVDNMIKLILDGLNGVAWGDDNQVLEVVGRKSYWTPKEDARTEVMVYRISLDDKPTRPCVHCGTAFPTFDSTSKRKYCSKECDLEVRRINRLKDCEKCGGAFDPVRGRGKKFCSDKCQRDGRRADIDCTTCGSSFTKPKSQVGTVNYCTPECRQVADETCKHGHPRAQRTNTRPDGRIYCRECHRIREAKKKASLHITPAGDSE